MAGSVERFFGGSPFSVLIKLVFASILVGALMTVLGFDPMGLVRAIVRQVARLADLGWGAVEQIGRWLVYGAVIVVPLWLIMRLAGGRR